MLRGIRNASTTWLGRIVMGAVMTLLAGIFALWGINDIFNGFGHSYLASIGKTEISVDQFRQNYNDRLQAMSRQLGKVITPEQASAFGLQQQVLSEMVAQAGLDQRAKQMGLGTIQRRDLAPDHRQPAIPDTGRQIRRRQIPGRATQRQPDRAALRHRPALQHAAAPDHRFRFRQCYNAENMARCRQPVPERAAQYRLCCARPGAGWRYRAANRRSAQQIFRAAPNHVPRSRIPQDRGRHGDAGGTRKDTGNLRRRSEEDLRR